MEFPNTNPQAPNPQGANPMQPAGPQPATPPMPSAPNPQPMAAPGTNPVSQAVNQSVPNPYSANPANMGGNMGGAPDMNNGMANPMSGVSNSMNPGPSLGNSDVHAMPEKFLATGNTAGHPGKAKSKHKNTTILLVVVIVLAVLAIGGGIGYYFWQGVRTPENTTVATAPALNTVVANTNVNTNNTNDADNANENVNANENDNTNANANENVNANANTNANTNTATTSENNANAVKSRDTDRDDLTNIEEQLFGTQADLPDTDGDGYIDGVEVLAGYDPTSATSSDRLASNATLTSSFSSPQYGYSVSYPADWAAESVPEAGAGEVLFTPTDLATAGQFVSLSVQNNSTGLTAADWYAQESGTSAADLEEITTFDDVAGVLSADGNTAYFASNGYLYVISLRYGNSAEVHFTTAFTFMAKSMTFTAPTSAAAASATTSSATNANTNTNANNSGGLVAPGTN